MRGIAGFVIAAAAKAGLAGAANAEIVTAAVPTEVGELVVTAERSGRSLDQVTTSVAVVTGADAC